MVKNFLAITTPKPCHTHSLSNLRKWTFIFKSVSLSLVISLEGTETECVYKDAEHGSGSKAEQPHLVFSVLLCWVVHHLTFFVCFSSLHNVLLHSEEKMEHLL